MWICLFVDLYHCLSLLYELSYHIYYEHVDLAHTHTVLWQVSLCFSRSESVTASPRGSRGGAVLGSGDQIVEVKEKSCDSPLHIRCGLCIATCDICMMSFYFILYCGLMLFISVVLHV